MTLEELKKSVIENVEYVLSLDLSNFKEISVDKISERIILNRSTSDWISLRIQEDGKVRVCFNNNGESYVDSILDDHLIEIIREFINSEKVNKRLNKNITAVRIEIEDKKELREITANKRALAED